MCNIAEDGQSPGVDTDEKETIAIVHAAAESHAMSHKDYAEKVRKLRLLALDLSHIQRGRMDASATVHLITKEQNPDIRLSATAAGWDAYEDEGKLRARNLRISPLLVLTIRHRETSKRIQRNVKWERQAWGGEDRSRRSRRASVRVRFEINKERKNFSC